jgi:hypothetical protein
VAAPGLLPVRKDATHGGYEVVTLLSPQILGFGMEKSEAKITHWETLSQRVHEMSAPSI